ncbi:hypothetical protein [Acinetobacter sp.]|uniref:hypothetical protein n=1 Tax=Acinetobacter sp. TaxID=472 RepID=UPI002FDB3471
MKNNEIEYFNENGQFSSLDDALHALEKGHCYSACAVLRANKDNCIASRDKIIQKLMDAVQYYLDETLNYFFLKRSGCRIFRYHGYDCSTYISYLNETLNFYEIQPYQKLILEKILSNGLDQLIDHFPNEYVLTQIADLIYDSNYDFPAKYVDLLSDWKWLKYQWQEQGIDKQQVWKQLIDVEMLKDDVHLEPDENEYFDDDLLPALHESDNLVISDHKPETLCDVFKNMTEGFLQGEIKWLDDKEIENISVDSWIQLNTSSEREKINPIEYNYFEYIGQYYQFAFDYSCADEFIAVIQAFNPFLQLFKPNLAVYLLPTDQEPVLFFTANKEKFDALNEVLKIPVMEWNRHRLSLVIS